MALKFVTKSKTKLKSFLREYSLTGTLSCSPFIIKVLDVLFETEDSYVFGQEYAPAGDLFDIIPPQVLYWIMLIICPPIPVLPHLSQSSTVFQSNVVLTSPSGIGALSKSLLRFELHAPFSVYRKASIPVLFSGGLPLTQRFLL